MTVENNCKKCGVCIKVCPVNNITRKNKNVKIALGNNCISCFACTHNCPTNSIRIKGEKSRARFRNNDIELYEIIESNN